MKKFLAAAVLVSLAGPSLAERMTGQEVAQLMSKGKIEFQAGSVWTTLPGGEYTFDHRNSSEAGTFKIFQKGDVHILDEETGKTIKFYFDKGADGVPALIYLNGPGKGNRYPIKM